MGCSNSVRHSQHPMTFLDRPHSARCFPLKGTKIRTQHSNSFTYEGGITSPLLASRSSCTMMRIPIGQIRYDLQIARNPQLISDLHSTAPQLVQLWLLNQSTSRHGTQLLVQPISVLSHLISAGLIRWICSFRMHPI